MMRQGTLQACALGAVVPVGCNRLPPRPKPLREIHAELRQHYDLFAPDARAERVARIRPHVEAVLGAPLGDPVLVVRLSRDMCASWLAEEAVRRSEGLNRTERNRLRIAARIHAWEMIGSLGMVRRPDEVEEFPREKIAPLTRDPDEGVRGLAWAMAGKEIVDQALSRGVRSACAGSATRAARCTRSAWPAIPAPTARRVLRSSPVATCSRR